MLTGYNPLGTKIDSPDVWIDPAGNYLDGRAHELQAEHICEIIYGETDVQFAGDILVDRGWVKATSSLMWDFYCKYDYVLSRKTWSALLDYCKLHNLEVPKKYIFKDESYVNYRNYICI